MELSRTNVTIQIPPQINVVVWKDNDRENLLKFFLYNNSKELKLYFKLEDNLVNFDKWTNSICLVKINYNNDIIKTENLINNFLKSWETYLFSKIKFKGKGFRIKFFKKIKLVKFFFGRSHKTFILFKCVKLKKINKYKFVLKHLKKTEVLKNARIATNIKKINFYTLRGLRKSRQIIYKRKGKKGTYI